LKNPVLQSLKTIFPASKIPLPLNFFFLFLSCGFLYQYYLRGVHPTQAPFITAVDSFPPPSGICLLNLNCSLSPCNLLIFQPFTAGQLPHSPSSLTIPPTRLGTARSCPCSGNHIFPSLQLILCPVFLALRARPLFNIFLHWCDPWFIDHSTPRFRAAFFFQSHPGSLCGNPFSLR